MTDGKAAMDALLRNMISGGLTPCATLALDIGGQPIYRFAEGYSRIGSPGRIEVDGHTRFNVGSVTKPFTASLIVKLAEMGLLTLEDPVKKHVPEFKFDTVTLLHLMTHTAGFDSSIDRHPDWQVNGRDIGAFLSQLYSIDTLANEPGAVSAYCTQYYTILMDVVERVSGKSIGEFAREALFEPLCMDNTGYAAPPEGSFAPPWKRCDENRFLQLRRNPPTGDSGLYTTAADLVKFGNMFISGGMSGDKRVFSRSAVDLMLREATDNRHMKTPIFWYKGTGGCRSAFGDLNSVSAVCHPGFSGTLLMIDPEYRAAFAFVTNSNDLHDDYTNFRKVCNAVMANLVV